MNTSLSHFDLDNVGKQDISLNTQTIICGMLEMSGILSENFYQAVGSPHPALLKARPWDLSHLQLDGRREAMHPKDQAAHTGKMPHPLLLGYTMQDKKVFLQCPKHCKCHPLFFEN